ncbi:UNVERIFIED_CONTAM: hypothetical protein GTU68_016415 [Idotea baltica]|nr:hypothetical protein [Idotea baltica]
MLVDDHEMIIDSLRLLFNLFDGFKVVCSESDSRNVLSVLEKEEVDILVTDFSMPYLDGLQLTQMVREKHPDIKVLLLTVNEDAADIQNAYNSGAAGYIMKKSNRKQIEEALKVVASGKKYYGQDVMELIMGDSPKSTEEVSTPREREILFLIAQEHTSREIASLLFLSTHTVDSHRKRLMEKWQVRNSAGLVRVGFERGILSF